MTGLRPARAVPPSSFPPEARVVDYLAGHQAVYRYRSPRYQIRLLKDLAALMPAGDCRVLDIGAGNGLIGGAIRDLFPGKSVMGVDISLRLLPSVGLSCTIYDGVNLPFADRSFDCALLCNVLHHVDPASRARVVREALRVTGGGPVIVKDHLARSRLDRLRLAALDLAGNLPFGGMVSAEYLGEGEWSSLLSQTGCTGTALPVSAYRSGLSALCFPNRLEFCFAVMQSPSSAA
jgi:SAM-dependent methyltransferase